MFQKNFIRKKTIFPHRDAKQYKDFKWSFTAFIEALILRLKSEKDALVLISGATGSGKSMLTGNFCLKHFAKIDNFITGEGKMFERDNFIIDPEELAVKMISKSGVVLWADEGRRAANRRQWYSKINNTIISRKNQNRKLFNIYFVLLPYEKEFDPALASHLTLWLWVRRGVAEVYCANNDKKGGQGLDILKILEREERWLKENPKSTFVLPTIHPEFIGRIFFRDLTPGYKREYNELVEEKKAVGELSDEEKLKFGIIEKMTPEAIINGVIDEIREGKIKSRRQVWNRLKKETELPDEKLQKQLNFYLKLEGFPTFNKLFEKKKKENLDDIF